MRISVTSARSRSVSAGSSMVLPALVLNYLGQAALLTVRSLRDPQSVFPAGSGFPAFSAHPAGHRRRHHRQPGAHHRGVLAHHPGDPARLPAAGACAPHLGALGRAGLCARRESSACRGLHPSGAHFQDFRRIGGSLWHRDRPDDDHHLAVVLFRGAQSLGLVESEGVPRDGGVSL